MKPLAMILLLAVTVQAQSIADAARQERARRAQIPPAKVITSVGPTTPAPVPAAPADAKEAAKSEAPKAEAGKAEAAKEPPKPPAVPAPDPAKIWNDQLDQLRAKIRNLQDQESALQLQLNQVNNQIFAPVVDPTAKDQAQAQQTQIQQQITSVRAELAETRQMLDAMQAQGPPKK